VPARDLVSRIYRAPVDGRRAAPGEVQAGAEEDLLARPHGREQTPCVVVAPMGTLRSSSSTSDEVSRSPSRQYRLLERRQHARQSTVKMLGSARGPSWLRVLQHAIVLYGHSGRPPVNAPMHRRQYDPAVTRRRIVRQVRRGSARCAVLHQLSQASARPGLVGSSRDRLRCRSRGSSRCGRSTWRRRSFLMGREPRYVQAPSQGRRRRDAGGASLAACPSRRDRRARDLVGELLGAADHLVVRQNAVDLGGPGGALDPI